MPRQPTQYRRKPHATPDHFPQRLEWFQHASGLTWAEIARRLGISPITIRHANMNDVNVEYMWTNNVNLVGTLNMDYMPAVMMHEFGHTVGLGHSAGHQDVMGYASDKSVLSANDKRAMREIYENHVAP